MFLGAVTGTNGKTSTVEFARQLMSDRGQAAASLGTLGLTGPDGRVADPFLPFGRGAVSNLADDLEIQGIESLFVEAYSSVLQASLLDEALVQAGAFTNLGVDHIHMHGSMNNYYLAKRRLIDRVVVAGGSAILNADVPQFEDLTARSRRRGIDVISYGWAPTADLRVCALRPGKHGPMRSEADLVFFGRHFQAVLNFGAEFMVANALCAAGLAMAAGTLETVAADGLEQLTAPEGRVQWIMEHSGAQVFVDYAHTPDALSAILRALRPVTSRQIILVFGCGGDRDASKRQLMGQVAADLADTVIITDDNPRSESAAEIRQSLLTACPTALEIPDRREGIGAALRLLRPGDVMLVAGKGHEDYQEVRGHRMPFSDRQIIAEHVRGADTPNRL